MIGRGASLLVAGAVTPGAASRPRLDAGPVYFGAAGAGAGAVVVAGASVDGSIMKLMRRSVAPAVRKANRPSIEVSKRVLDCLILVMMMSSESLACKSLMTSRLVMAAGTGAAALGAAFLGAGAGCAGADWGSRRTVDRSVTKTMKEIQAERFMKFLEGKAMGSLQIRIALCVRLLSIAKATQTYLRL